jgi:hypothetical protein
MIKIQNTASLGSAKKSVIGLLAVLFLLCSVSAQATAPRVAPKLFGDEKPADIVGYQFVGTDSAARPISEFAIALVTEAYKAVGKAPVIDVLPSKQLATYALTNNDAAVLIGTPQDVSAKEQKQYRTVVFYIHGTAPGETLVALIFGNKKVESKALYSAFNEGMKKLIKSGRYLAILSDLNGKGSVPANALTRLKSHNPSWK